MALSLRSVVRAVIWLLRLRRAAWLRAYRAIAGALVPRDPALAQRALQQLTVLDARFPVLGYRVHPFGVEFDLESDTSSEGVWDW